MISYHFPNDVLWAILHPVFRDYTGHTGAQLLAKPHKLPAWDRIHLYHSFHPEPHAFRHKFLPRLSRLRHMYRSRACTLQVVTVLREPASMMLSAYRFFRLDGGLGVRPSLSDAHRVMRNTSSLARDFSQWLGANTNPQSAWLNGTLPFQVGVAPRHTAHNGHPFSHVPVMTQTLLSTHSQLLAPFDFVGVSERLNELLWFLVARLGVYLPALERNRTLEARLPVCNQNTARASTAAMASVLRDGAILEDVSRATPQDEALYRVALSRYMSDVEGGRELRAHADAARALDSNPASIPGALPMKLPLGCHKGSVAPFSSEAVRSAATVRAGEPDTSQSRGCPSGQLICTVEQVQGEELQRVQAAPAP
uniref:Sulfotransferase domain-containing protein n=1 Tax=Prymnesium polylepis TaxID=72548 RepID=A0A7S4J3I9_9EUKA|mmetsp:Transcript_38795/g.96776  ORF Transcript_38795/g.96776 Transcript_38795/m.96776 type:complete len:366 (+) Transcript_38795:499-1596(+)